MNATRGPFTPCHNGQATARDEIPAWEFADFRQAVLEQVTAGRPAEEGKIGRLRTKTPPNAKKVWFFRCFPLTGGNLP